MDYLRQMFAAIEAQMSARLKELRATQTHRGLLGAGVENVLRDFLREYLPRRLDLGQGVVIDAEVGRSRQTDVVIVTQDHPRTFEGNDPGLFFIEGVYAAGEVKTTLTSTNLIESLERALVFRSLQPRNFPHGTKSFGTPKHLERFALFPPWFIFAFESELELASIRDRLEKYDSEYPCKAGRSADAVIVLGEGAVLNVPAGSGSLRVQDAAGNFHDGVLSLPSNTPLWDFLWWLSVVPPPIERMEPVLTNYRMPR